MSPEEIPMETKLERRPRDESGIALLVAVLFLLMVSAIGIAVLNRAGDERIGAVSSRRLVANVSAAEAGLRDMQMQLKALAKVGITPVGLSVDYIHGAFNDRSVVKEPLSPVGTSVRTGAIGTTGPQPIISLGQTACDGEKAQGKQITQCYAYRVDVTATDPGGGNTQVQAQYLVTVSSGGIGY
jgi:hypothetical protein